MSFFILVLPFWQDLRCKEWSRNLAKKVWQDENHLFWQLSNRVAMIWDWNNYDEMSRRPLSSPTYPWSGSYWEQSSDGLNKAHWRWQAIFNDMLNAEAETGADIPYRSSFAFCPGLHRQRWFSQHPAWGPRPHSVTAAWSSQGTHIWHWRLLRVPQQPAAAGPASSWKIICL